MCWSLKTSIEKYYTSFSVSEIAIDPEHAMPISRDDKAADSSKPPTDKQGFDDCCTSADVSSISYNTVVRDRYELPLLQSNCNFIFPCLSYLSLSHILFTSCDAISTEFLSTAGNYYACSTLRHQCSVASGQLVSRRNLQKIEFKQLCWLNSWYNKIDENYLNKILKKYWKLFIEILQISNSNLISYKFLQQMYVTSAHKLISD